MMNTRHSLYTCTLSLLLCISIFLCTIFACFTHYGTSNGNIIQSDNLQTQMYRTDNLINADTNHFLMTAGGDNVAREFYSTEVDANRTYNFDYWHTHQIEPTLVDYFIPTYKCILCGDIFERTTDYIYDGSNTDYIFTPNGASTVELVEGKYSVMFEPATNTPFGNGITAGNGINAEADKDADGNLTGWYEQGDTGNAGSQSQFWIPTNGRDNNVEGFSDFSCANNSVGVISFKMKTSMDSSLTLTVAKERYPEASATQDINDWTGWGTSSINILSIGGVTEGADSITLKGGIGAGTTLTNINVTDGWSDEFEVAIGIKLKNDNTIALTYYVNGTLCGTFSSGMTIDTYDIRSLYLNGWTYTANTGFVFDDLSIKYTTIQDYLYDGSDEESPYVYYTNDGTQVGLDTSEGNYSISNPNGTTGIQPQFWFPSNANGQGFSGFSCENNSLGVISFKISSSMTNALTLAVAKERNASDWTGWGTSSINILSIGGITEGADSITLKGGIGAGTTLTNINVTDGWSDEFEVIIFIKLKDDNTIILSYYINGEFIGSFSDNMTIDSYDIRALYLSGWTYAENTGYELDDLSISYTDNGHFDYHYGLRAVDGIEGRYESICTCCNTVYGYVDDLYYLTYEDCGATGDGITDDSEAIRRTHELANYAGLPILANGTKTYYIGKITETITIKTDTDWNGASFIFDDKQIRWDDSARSVEVFTVASDSSVVTIANPEELANGLTEGQTNLGMTFDKACMVKIENSNEKIFIRSGVNVASQNKQELLLVEADGSLTLDSEGNIKTPIQYDYGTITKITLYPIDDEPIEVGNATITTNAPNPKNDNIFDGSDFENSNNNGYFRGLSVRRSNTTIYNVEHIVENEMLTIVEDRDGDGYSGDDDPDGDGYPEKWTDDKSYGVTYYGFFNFVNSYNVTMKDCVVEGHQAYSFIDTIKNADGTSTGQTARNETGSYDIKAENCVYITFDNIRQSEHDTANTTVDNRQVITNRFMYHGIMGSNWCRNMIMDRCYLDRFDAHQGMHNATITNSTLGFGILVIGGGTLYVENVCRPDDSSFIHLRTDYNSVFTGDVIIKNCQMGTGVDSIVVGKYTATHCGIENYMIKNLTVDGLTFVDPTGLTYVDPDATEGVVGNCSNLAAGTRDTVYVYNVSNAKEANITDVNPILLPASVYLSGIKNTDGTRVLIDASKNDDVFEGITITKNSNEMFTVTYNANGGSVSPASADFWINGTALTLPTPTYSGYTLNGWYDAAYGGNKIGDAGASYTPTADITLYAQWTEESSENCITGDTLVTLADGTQKRMDEITEDDVVLVFDHETGEYATMPLLYYVNDGVNEYRIINLKFSDGNVTRLIYEHALFDMTLNQYVYIRENNYNEFIGHEFAKDNGNGGFIRVVLEEGYITEEIVGCYSITSLYHLNYYINGMLSLPGAIDGLFNYFEYDPTTLKYDEEQMQKDIETYGLYTYEDFAEYATPEMFETVLPAHYLMVAVGKGLITFEGIIQLINTYLV